MTRSHKILLLGGLYLAQGLPFGFFTQALPVLLRDAGYFLGAIGKWGVDPQRPPTAFGFHVYVSERDYARKVVLLGRSSAETQVWQIMSAPVVTAAPDDGVRHCMQVMTEKRIRHLPVVEDGRMIGMISIGDLVRVVIEEQDQTIEHLNRFIAG